MSASTIRVDNPVAGNVVKFSPAANDIENSAEKPWKPKRLDLHNFPDQAIGQGSPPPTIANVKHLLDGNGISARYNVIKKKAEIVIPCLSVAADNSESVSIAHIKSLLALHGMQNGDARAIVDAIANQTVYNPVADWIGSKPWDGIDRLQSIYDTIRTVEDYPVALKEAILYHWLLSAVAAVLKHTGFSTRLVLTLQGPQSIGKTRWCMSLVPDQALRASFIKTDHHFDGASKDSILSAIRFWIVELGELESSFRKDKERLKGTITRDTDVVRPPYATADSEFPRRTVFMASANGSDFLSDASGSTRWGVIAVESINFEHDIDMQQLFAQLAVDFQDGKQWWLSTEQEAELQRWNERHEETSIVRDAVRSVIDFEGDDTKTIERLTASEVLRAAGIEHPTLPQARECGGLIRAKFGPPTKVQGVFRWKLPIRPGVDPQVLPKAPAPKKSKFD